MKYPHVESAKKYAESVVSGKIDVCKWVKLACKRQLNDLKKYKKAGKKYYFSEEKAEKACKFIEFLPHIKGEWARRKESIKLEPWQCFIYVSVFGWLKKDGTRRFRTVYIEVPRKNSKSTMSSGTGLFMLTADEEPGAEIYSAATTRDQAKIVFDVAQKMARKEKDLCDHYGVQVNAHNINVIETASKFEPLSSEGNSLDGLNVHCGIIDELHAHKTRSVFDVIETGTGARVQSLLWLITTAGSDRSGICYEQRTYLTKILEGVAQDDTYFGVIYTIDDDGDDWTDPKVWAKANPNYNISVYPDDIARLCQKAMQMPSAQNNFLTKRLNVWVNADTAWMNMLAWDKCADHSLKIERFEKKQCIVGVDLASKVDMAVRANLFCEDGHYYAFLNYYLPEETVENNSNSQYSGWERQGLLTTTPGAVIDFTYIEDDLRDDSKRFKIIEVPYDPFQATEFSTRMANEGFPVVEMRATVQNFSEPMKQLEALVLDGKFHFDGDPILTWMVSNVVCHMDKKDNIYPNKERFENKIDGVIAILMALNRWLANQPKESVYEKRGLLII